jgi:hypothetical protein
MPKLSSKYGKIMSVYERDGSNKRRLIEGKWATPELAYLKDLDWVFTEKLDGTNIRVTWDGEEAVFGGRSEEAQIPTKLLLALNEMFKSYDSREALKSTFPNASKEETVVLYGEGLGAGIQPGGGNYKPDGNTFVLFDVFAGGMYLKRESVEDIANKLKIKVAPVIGHGTLKEAIEMTREGFKSRWGDFIAEGIVARPAVELMTRRGDRVIAKVKHRDFK